MIDPLYLRIYSYLHTYLFFLSFWGRGIPDCGPGVQARFKDTFEQFFEAVNFQAQARDQDIFPDLESYIDVRRDTSGKSKSIRYWVIQ
jgi:hypothetical protein